MPPTKPKYMSESVNEYLVVKKEIIEEKRSSGGIILNIPSAFDFEDKFSKKNICYAEVIYTNHSIPFVRSGDRIVMNPTKGTKATKDYEDFTVITKDQFIAKIDKSGKFIVPPDSIMIKIKKEDTDNLYSKWIVRNDGTKVQLFIQPEPDKDSDKRSKIYVSLGEIVQTGENIADIEIGDIAILDYTVDNCIDNVLYYDEGGNKFSVIDGTTTFHYHDQWAYATRNNSRDCLVSAKGEMDIVSPLLGIIRNDKLIARSPYVFIEHKDTIVEKTSQFGILFTEQEELLERKILSVSDISNKKYGMKSGQTIVLKDVDMFSISLKDSKIDCVMDIDVMAGVK